jgi:hypothetical protein
MDGNDSLSKRNSIICRGLRFPLYGGSNISKLLFPISGYGSGAWLDAQFFSLMESVRIQTKPASNIPAEDC